VLLFFLNLSGEVTFYGTNDIQYTYKYAPDSLNHYFENRFSFTMNYRNLTFGNTFIAELPKYDPYTGIEHLDASDLSYRWDERYLSYSMGALNITGGMFEETFGSGMMFSSYYDREIDHDTRLTGGVIRINERNWHMKALYAALPNENREDRSDIAYGVDIERTLWGRLSVAASAISYRHSHILTSRYNQLNLYGGRLSYSLPNFADLHAEYAIIDEDNAEFTPREGHAIYADLNLYISDFTISGAYKNYNRFDLRLNDLPMVNNTEEPLSEAVIPGYDDEGVMASVQYNPGFRSQYKLSYAEGWNNDFSIRQNDLYLNYRFMHRDYTINTEYTHFERLEKEINRWEKILTPAVSVDFIIDDKPIHLYLDHEVKENKKSQELTRIFQPTFQTDIEFDELAVTLILSYPYEDFDTFFDNKLWLGVELSRYIYTNTQIRLFAGQERGGKVCRQGVCRYQEPFEGLRLNVMTVF
jgi:hypothetical protein